MTPRCALNLRRLGATAHLIALAAALGGSAVIAQTTRPAAPGERGDSALSLALRFRQLDKTYFVIENEFTDRASVEAAIPLSFSQTIRDRRSIVQSVIPPTTKRAAPAGATPSVRLEWLCDRYEARERNSLKPGETAYDSLRDAAPPEPLTALSQIPESRTQFDVEPATGAVSNLIIREAPNRLRASRQTSNVARRCLVTHENALEMLALLGGYFLPDRLVRVGDAWTRRHVQQHRPYGEVSTTLTCTLRSADEIDGRVIATIDLKGEAEFHNPYNVPTTTETSQPAGAPTRSSPRRGVNNYDLNRSACIGTLRFDVTRGQIVELSLRREMEFVAELGGQDGASSQPAAGRITQGLAHVVRVTALDDPPPKPVVVRPPAASAPAAPSAISMPTSTRPVGAATAPPGRVEPGAGGVPGSPGPYVPRHPTTARARVTRPAPRLTGDGPSATTQPIRPQVASPPSTTQSIRPTDSAPASSGANTPA